MFSTLRTATRGCGACVSGNRKRDHARALRRMREPSTATPPQVIAEWSDTRNAVHVPLRSRPSGGARRPYRWRAKRSVEDRSVLLGDFMENRESNGCKEVVRAILLCALVTASCSSGGGSSLSDGGSSTGGGDAVAANDSGDTAAATQQGSAFGGPCHVPDDCTSSVCFLQICSKACEVDADCPDPWRCDTVSHICTM